jgi:hypothetical protein
MDVIENIHKSAYAKTINLPLVMQGWIDGHFDAYFEIAMKDVKSLEPLIIEVGSWKGLSASRMANYLKTNKLKGKIICVDTWLGSPEHQRMPELMRSELGAPAIMYQFIANMQHLGLTEYVYPFPISSIQGGHFMEENHVEADVIYIDAGHEYEAVRIDIEIFWRLLKCNGTMIFDDYRWPGVRRAIDEFAEKQGLKVITVGNVARLQKTSNGLEVKLK